MGSQTIVKQKRKTNLIENFMRMFVNLSTMKPGIRSSHQNNFRKYLFFFFRSNRFIIFQEGPFVPQTDMNFPGGSYVLRTDTNFPRGLIEKTCFSRRFYLFVEQTFSSHRTDTNFPRNSYLVLEHILIFQEPLFCHRTDTHFPGSPI